MFKLQHLITGVIVLILVTTSIKILQLKKNHALLTQQKTSATLKQIPTLISAHEIVTWHLFGKAPIIANNYPLTSLPLKLVGVLASNNNQHALAIIESVGEKAKVYGVAEQLPGGGKIQQIIVDAVIIDTNGELTQLPLEMFSKENF